MLRVCVEFLSPAELRRPEVVRLLARHGVAPMLAVRPGGDEDALAALAPYIEAGLPACAWPLLDDIDGYWPAVDNAARAVARIDALIECAHARAAHDGGPLPWIAVDLEPSLGAVAELRRGSLARTAYGVAAELASPARRERFSQATSDYAALQKRMLQRNIRGLAIAWPSAAADFATPSGTAMQRLAAAPLRCGWDRVAVMTYGSLIAGWSRRLLDVEDARWFSYRALSLLARALGERAGAFVGLVGKGKLGDEPSYHDPEPLRRDAACARAAGAGEISLYGLEGVLDSRAPERWLTALAAPPERPPFRLRGELLHRSTVAAARLFAGRK